MEWRETLIRLLGKILFSVVIVVVVGVGICYWWFTSNYPKVGAAPEMNIAATPEMLARGEYLAKHVCLCLDCHTVRDWRYYSGPIDTTTLGRGGELFDEALMGIPGDVYSANITPAGIGRYSDGELFRTITTGVQKEGTALFNLMPYDHYRVMAQDDIKAVIAYLRTLKPIEYTVPARRLNFPVNLIVRTMPRAADLQPMPDTLDEVAYGGYLVNASACFICHTPMNDKGQPIAGREFAGGFEFHFPNGTVNRSANITPDSATGIGNWTREQFIARFRKLSADSVRQVPLDPTAYNTAMPWTMYNGMTDKDLGAIYAYLHTVKPISHKVEHFARETMAAH
jgi:mono/diheme cytochrome c family protein